ncbi:Asp-tRNA(Asn)/Glu-tRNA(Gln) amidotransferase subunit GatC [Insolitispirillum peregrinum]|uniref:Aspartyl/glutamyl-tRNA(Asn/Gln) amidotransferase subunit C n=1 Tax=Insolitispirillum peregrinum TaxID=80876 RepID=A0A1N7NGG1_9PROT|nr:Asp-tRNA(Asn)/Glu-tRNA(Gln) amidotransferase subunit GatC [Insolitispirillum peregrinum]SIS97269.1 aspartyl/glutamyl-tRNA(Asn/Gln) amidotransferase subunit C [Insolitispirillum peregrinum]
MLDKQTVRNIAFLARIDVKEDDLEPLANQLSGIIGWVEQLGEVNTDGVAPMTSVTNQVLRWRADELTDGGRADQVVLNAPDKLDGCFAVPKMVE